MIIKMIDKFPKPSLNKSILGTSKQVTDHYNTVEGLLTYSIQCSNVFLSFKHLLITTGQICRVFRAPNHLPCCQIDASALRGPPHTEISYTN